MNNFKNITLGLIGATLLALGFYSCNSDETVDGTKAAAEQSVIATKDFTEVAIPEVQEYYNNLKTIIFATEINKLDVVNSLADKQLPIIEKLQNMDLVNDETNQPLTFFDLEDEDQQIDFIDQYLDEEAVFVSSKVKQNPELIASFTQENEVITNILNEYGVVNATTKVSNRASFFDRIIGDLGALRFPLNPVPVEGIPLPIELPTKEQILRNKLAKMNIQRGDIFVALPTHGMHFQLIDLFNKRFKVGHAGIVTQNITTSTNPSQNVLVEAWSTVQNKQIEDWVDADFYVLEFKRKSVRLVISWKKVKFVTTYHPVNKNGIANYATGKLGRSYVKNLFEFGAMKVTAKNLDRYTCTSLVWRSSDVAVGIKPSHWLDPNITPRDLVVDAETFEKGQIK